MNNRDRLRTRLRAANPVDPERLDLSESELELRLASALRRPEPIAESFDDSPQRSASRYKPIAIAIGLAAATLVVGAVIAFLPASEPAAPADALAAAASVAAEQPPVALETNQFIYRRAETWTTGIPGVLFNGQVPSPQGPGVDRRAETEVFLNYTGGGKAATKNLEPTGDEARNCTEPEIVITFIVEGSGSCGYLSSDQSLFDERLGLPAGPFNRDELGTTGAGVDDLPTDPVELAAVLDDAAARRAAQIQKDGSISANGATKAAAKLTIVSGILANPLGSPDLRAAVFEYAKRIDAISIASGVTDPVGRTGTAISLDEPSRYGHITIAGPGASDDFHLDDEDTVVRRQLIFDPDTSDVLATTTSLVQTDNELLAPWLADVGAPAPVEYEIFDQPKVVDRPDLVLERLQCPNGQTVIRRAGSNDPCPSVPPAEAGAPTEP
jgi:hypothetical protein